MVKIERTRNALRNIVFGIVLKVYQILIPFIMRTVMIYIMGVQYLGLNSLFTSILQVLNLAELGVGSAMVYSMYKPIAEDDHTMICALMKLYKIYYRIIGLIIAVVGGLLTPFVSILVKGEIPNSISLNVLYLLNLGATVLSYWLFAYKNAILQAHQRTDVISKIKIITVTFQYVLQILILFLFHNYYLYVIVMLIEQIMNNILTAIWANHLFPNYQPMGSVNKQKKKEINQKVRDLFTSKIGAVVVDSADTIVISSFLGLVALAIYQNYYYIINSITGFIIIFYQSIGAGIGNSLITETGEKNYHDFEVLNYILFGILNFCVSCFLVLIQPFMKIWVGKELMLPDLMIILFCVYFSCNVYEKFLSLFKDAAGIWREDRFRPLIYGISNLLINILLVRIIGLYGIIISTILTCSFVSLPWLINNVFRLIYKKSKKNYLKQVLKYVIVILGSGSINVIVCSFINSNIIVTLLLRGMISLVVPNMFYLLILKKDIISKDSMNLLKETFLHRKNSKRNMCNAIKP